MTYRNGFEWLFHVKLGFRTSTSDSDGSTFKDSCMKSNKPTLTHTNCSKNAGE